MGILIFLSGKSRPETQLRLELRKRKRRSGHPRLLDQHHVVVSPLFLAARTTRADPSRPVGGNARMDRTSGVSARLTAPLPGPVWMRCRIACDQDTENFSTLIAAKSLTSPPTRLVA
ncbi:hypothetical protein NHU_02760 [Rhodovulum sulfidophilum]|uniref:Uncharacterized protein n=1 Tax=Rhodovulum sulfidophilum TaxID=35806 RepID=A0A0D6B485_RHOSU|nr:hypothetical protein NHU_02760 [Rhodovulum sulfidophilum]